MAKLADLLDGKTVTLSRKDIEEMVVKEIHSLPGVDQRRPLFIRIVFDGENCEARVSFADTLPDRGVNGR